MKKNGLGFLNRGLVACGFGPIVLAVIYLILKGCGVIETLAVSEVCIGIFSLSALAFIAGGLTSIYKIERLPLMSAILIHGGDRKSTRLNSSHAELSRMPSSA